MEEIISNYTYRRCMRENLKCGGGWGWPHTIGASQLNPRSTIGRMLGPIDSQPWITPSDRGLYSQDAASKPGTHELSSEE